jgi:hypothetical protein
MALAAAAVAAERTRLQEATEAARVEAAAMTDRVQELEGQVAAATAQAARVTRQANLQVRRRACRVERRGGVLVGRCRLRYWAANMSCEAGVERPRGGPGSLHSQYHNGTRLCPHQALQLKELEAAKALLEGDLAAARSVSADAAPDTAAAAASQEQARGGAVEGLAAVAGADTSGKEDVGDAMAADQAARGGRRARGAGGKGAAGGKAVAGARAAGPPEASKRGGGSAWVAPVVQWSGAVGAVALAAVVAVSRAVAAR